MLLHRNNKINQGLIFPLNEWKGIYFSELLKKAVLKGYEIKFLSKYTFNLRYLFNDYF